MRQLELYLYHLIPLKNGVNALPLMPLLFPDGMSERTLLLSIWAVLWVGVGVLLPCSYVYSCQLSSRRLWRRAELKRQHLRQLPYGKCPAAKFDASMNLVPVWTEYLPAIWRVQGCQMLRGKSKYEPCANLGPVSARKEELHRAF
ncbi:hypothetical protein COCSUDRAFT_44326 [Coccomyxa subellipsoidea C-169]|uniref:Uncharacterized protein n=1 Tax=Coccomyxa subellipsoidea (strain C-169) TaxID=574566 RepID=I0YNF4_COCSC|nr:hypothetical protein COCSUDRAFT_44326 [Coccomyxa subellipsoidea C-169]EIE19923.1 hypothetical protein COCSUDRAFT_44326 [Coccomyxa subellipsoidea C-169]|eukprot:XP_005644467.1 hypothetical protein COCSUDRAFT_44326 [Coccomyxa subellipsoidea C-169]